MNNVPITAITLSAITLVCSLVVAYSATNFIFGTVPVVKLSDLGGITVADLYRLEVWRLFTSQVIHSKQIHMLYNVVSLILLGYGIEKHLGWHTFLLTWFITGASGTLYSTLFVEAPWNVGTGGSQAIFGLIGFSFVLLTKLKHSLFLIGVLLFSFVPALMLDILFAHYPKPGHIMSLTAGMLIGTLRINNLATTKAQ